MIDDLYSAKVLKLAANLPHAGRLTAPHASAEKVSKLCGSRVVVDVAVEGDGRVRFGEVERGHAVDPRAKTRTFRADAVLVPIAAPHGRVDRLGVNGLGDDLVTP